MNDANQILELLLRQYPNPKIELHYSNPLELLIATLLSAQCTDARVNQVTATLFKKYRSARAFAEADLAMLEQEVRPTGFYKNKAKLIVNCCKRLVEVHQGEVPMLLEALTELPGVGRKTANMVLGNAFRIPGIAVDTHVLRVANRLGLANSQKENKVEEMLMAKVPKERWVEFTNAMILHGRRVCTARNPRCGACVLYPVCEWPDKDKSRL